MEPSQRLAILETLFVAAERRREVADAVWTSANEGEAKERLRELLGIQGDLLPQVIIDMQIRILTRKTREAIITEINQLRRLAADRPHEVT